MPTDADLATFLNRVPTDGSTIGNGALRKALDWEDARYDTVRDALVDQGKLEKGRGRGGSVRRIGAPAAQQSFLAPATIASLPPSSPQPSQAQAKPQPLASVTPVSVVKAQPKPGNAMFEQTFKNIDDILHKDAGCTSELDYTEQSSWLLFLKYLDALEQDKATEAALEGKPYTFILDKPYRWETWAAPKGADGKVDHNTAMTGDDLRDFVNHKLCPYLQGFKQRAIKNTFLSNTDNASVSLRKLLLESCNLHTVLDCPGGTFQGAGVKTVVLFFEKGAPTRKVWYYQLDPGRNMGKTNPLNDADLVQFVELHKTFADSPQSWSVDAATINPSTFDLSVKNPNGGEVVTHRSPQEIMEEIAALDTESAEVLGNIRALL